MAVDLKNLWQRERARRAALWDLEGLRPGDESAKPHLSILDEIDRQDLEQPHGEAQVMTIEELRNSVPETPYVSSDGHHFVIVLDHHIPEIWRTRFEAANSLSERFSQGSYAHDWRRFLRVWIRDMEHLAAHRLA
ncbi:hypothetical protein [Pseudomonas corrugata]|uniref:hypothetical protein n=1 Tax=Pseudomonas corrugata TaxID=47879 RepID=UPI000464C850|nr:hypothetical protein [Pseudomonas corrugata]